LETARALCVDTDALVNLLALDVFDAALALLQFTRAQCFRLRVAEHQVERAAWVENRWPFFDRSRALPVVRDLKVLQQQPRVELLEILNINGIDVGEAYLLAALTDNPEYLLLSGDKRMLEALHAASDPRLVAVREAVRGRVLLFPQVLAALVGKLSLEVMEGRFRSSLCRHRTLKILFGTQRPTDPDHFREAYESEMKSYAAICGQDWLFSID
jgi:hypothetical protein